MAEPTPRVTKTTLIEDLLNQFEGKAFNKTLCEELMLWFPQQIQGYLAKGVNVQWTGLGTFSRKVLAAGKIYSPRLGTKIKMPSRRLASFRLSRKVHEAVAFPSKQKKIKEIAAAENEKKRLARDQAASAVSKPKPSAPAKPVKTAAKPEPAKASKPAKSVAPAAAKPSASKPGPAKTPKTAKPVAAIPVPAKRGRPAKTADAAMMPPPAKMPAKLKAAQAPAQKRA